MSPTGRTLHALRRSGYTAGVVEAWIPGANVRRDLFGVADVIAVRAGEPGALLVQCTTAANLSSRRRKVEAAPAVRVWLAAGNRFELWGWYRRPGSAHGGQLGAGTWEAKRETLTLTDLAGVAVVPIAPRRRRRQQQRGERQRDLFS